MARNGSLRSEVLEVLLKHKGDIVTLQQILDQLPTMNSRSSVQTVMGALGEINHLGIEAIVRGNSWMIGSKKETPKAPSDPIPAAPKADKNSIGPFELIGSSVEGGSIVRDPKTGKLFTMKAL